MKMKMFKVSGDPRIVLIFVLWLINVLLLVDFGSYFEFKKVEEKKQTTEEYLTCLRKLSSPHSLPKLDEIKDIESTTKRIFFIETACNEVELDLSCRQACAVESAAHTNPWATIYLLFLNPLPPSKKADKLLQLLREYYGDRIFIRRVNLTEYFEVAPVDLRWFNNSLWPENEISNVIRVLTLWKFGGIYLDLDMVLMKSLEDLSNFMVSQPDGYVNNAVLGLDDHGSGFQIANTFLFNVSNTFKNRFWGRLGFDLMTRVVQNFCGVRKAVNMTADNCQGFKVLPPKTFYPLDYPRWGLYFSNHTANDTIEEIKNSRAIHLWNMLSKSVRIEKGRQVPYTIVAKRFCPIIYKNCDDNF